MMMAFPSKIPKRVIVVQKKRVAEKYKIVQNEMTCVSAQNSGTTALSSTTSFSFSVTFYIINLFHFLFNYT